MRKAKEAAVKALKAEKRTWPREASRALDEAYIHLTAKRHTTRSLARALGVSVATAFRWVRALRRRGLRIESMKEGRQWYFSVREDEEIAAAWDNDPLLGLVGSVGGGGRRGQSVDDAVYGRK